MSLNRYARKIDLNQPEIVQALRAVGARVWVLSKPFDLLVGFRGRFVVLEVKSTRRTRKDQQHQTDEIHDCQAGGLPVYRVESVEQALAVLNPPRAADSPAAVASLARL